MTHVSIIICTKDRAASLRETLASLTNCKVGEWTIELLVVDNGSTDHTRQVVESAILRNMSLRYLHEPRLGLCHARNAGLAEARGDIIVFTDDDVRVEPHWIQHLCQPLLEGKGDASAGVIMVAPDLRRGWLLAGFPSFIAGRENLKSGPTDFLVGANLAMTRAAFSSVGPFDTELGPGALGFGDDGLFSLQLREAGNRLVAVPEAVVIHHFDPSRLSFGSLWTTAEKMGRSEAYIHYHWQHDPWWRWQWLSTSRHTLSLVVKRAFGGRAWTGSGVPQYWMLPLVMAWGFYRQYALERKRPRNYTRRGFRKIGQ